MKTLFSSLLAVTLLFFLTSFLQQNQSTKKAPVVVSPFSGMWRGGEKCQGVSAPTSILSIRQRSAQEVLISGIYSTQGDVKAEIKGNTLLIPMQEVKDPNFVNFFIGGKLTLSDNRKTLRGNFVVRNNTVPDTCAAAYFLK